MLGLISVTISTVPDTVFTMTPLWRGNGEKRREAELEARGKYLSEHELKAQ
jgi:hypothetical protein